MSGPDFIVIGAMKCGTSTVCAYLEDHPEVFMVPGAEPNFFSHDENHAKGTAWYEAEYFADRGGARLAGEGSNNYASLARFPQTVTRMAAYKPDLKIIYIVRHPLDRIVSAWIQRRRDAQDNVPPTLDRAVTEMPEMFVDQSLYWKTVETYRAAFGPDRVFVGFMEDLKADPETFFTALCDFLQIAPVAQAKRGHLNKSAGKSIPSPLYTRVNQLPGMRALKRLSPTPLRHWLKERFLTQKITDRPAFSEPVLAQLQAQLDPDSAALLAAYGKSADFWKPRSGRSA
ncbi:sulfotransferase family protein [Roseobacter sp. A03A-229]